MLYKLLVILFIFLDYSAQTQNPSDSGFLRQIVDSTIAFYTKNLGGDLLLYNGREYTGNYSRTIGHPFYGYKTYEGDLGGFELDPNAVVVEYEGIQLQREFYSPTYSAENKTENRLPDFRNLLYWSPDLITNHDGKGGFSFYTSEIPGTYAVVICGMANDGSCGSVVTTFSVSNK